jgi:ferric iron reductase protein FhuF
MEREDASLKRRLLLMHRQLNKEEISILKGMRFSSEIAPSSLLIEMELFLVDEQRFYQYFELIKEKIGSPNDKVTASIFLKRYAFLAVIYFYAMTAWNKRLNINVNNLVLISNEKDKLWLPSFSFTDLSFVEATPASREEWRRETVRLLFAENLSPVIERLTQKTKISKYILWENIAVYIFWLYETVFEKENDVSIRTQAHFDLDFLINQAPGDIFGGCNQNPLVRNYTVPVFIKETGDGVRIRKTCCFSYELDNNPKRCNTCPNTCRQLVNGLEIKKDSN